MQLGGLRGTKLELKGALEAPKETPRQPKRVRLTSAMLRGVAKGCTLRGGGPELKNLSKLR